jgi:hypothetical protein
MNNENRYEEIAQRSRSRRLRDFAFALLLAAVAVGSMGAIRAAAANVDLNTAAHQTADQVSGASCTLEPSC